MKLLRRTFSTFLLLSVLACAPATGRALNGVVSHVTDGDTLWVRPAGNRPPVQVRVQGIDAPEICQPFGTQARDALAARLLHRTVRVATRARDKYQRSVGNVSLDGQDIGAWLVAGGFAWASSDRGRAGRYANEEAQARRARRGLWATSAEEPRLFRKRHGSCRPRQ